MTIAPRPIDRNAAILTSSVPDSATNTVSADTKTALPLVAIALPSASGTSPLFFSSLRKRVKTNSE